MEGVLMSMTSSVSHHQAGGINETSLSHVVSKALSCIQSSTQTSIEIRNALDAVIRLFLEEYRNRSRNDDLPQVDLRFAQITSKLLFESFGIAYGSTATSDWFYQFLLEHAKGLTELVDLQFHRDEADNDGDPIIQYERSRYLDIMALLASIPAPTCSICRESLFYSCITCHHCCVTKEDEEMEASVMPKPKRRRTNKSSEGPPLASPTAEKRGRSRGGGGGSACDRTFAQEELSVHEPEPKSKESVSRPSESPDGVPSTPCDTTIVSVSPYGVDDGPPPSTEMVGDLSSISSDVSSRSPAILTEAEQNSRPDAYNGRPPKRRVNVKASYSDATGVSQKRHTMRLSRISENRPKRLLTPLRHRDTATRSEIGTAMVCVNCRPKFACALQTKDMIDSDKHRLCGGIVLLSRFSLSQLALLFTLLIDKLKEATSLKGSSWESSQPEGLRLLHQQNQTVTASLIRHVHRFPRLVDLADLCKALSHRLYKWDMQVASYLVDDETESLNTARQKVPNSKEIAASRGSSSSSEEAIGLKHHSSAQSTSSVADSQKSSLQVPEEAATSTVNESLMDRLSPQGTELLSRISWAYLCAAGRCAFRLWADERPSRIDFKATLKSQLISALRRVLSDQPQPSLLQSPAMARKRRV